jgi:putative serine protease PepD
MGRFWVLCGLVVLFVSLSGASEHTFNQYEDSLVSVKEADESLMKGSGFVYGPEEYIITNNHVAVSENGSEQDLEVRFNRSGEWIEVKTIGRDPETDLAVLEPDSIPEDVESLQISNSTLELGQNLTVVGNNPAVSRPIFVSGTVIDLSENITTKENVTLDDSVVISAAIELGFSGGPTIDSEGQVVGVTTARDTTEDIGFIIPASKLKSILPVLTN